MATFYTGNTGASTGPHLDLQVFNPSTGSYEDPGKYTSFLTVGDNKDPFNFRITSPRGMRLQRQCECNEGRYANLLPKR